MHLWRSQSRHDAALKLTVDDDFLASAAGAGAAVDAQMEKRLVPVSQDGTSDES